MIDNSTLYAVVLLLVKVSNPVAIRKACLESLKIPAEEVDAAIEEARKLITLAADFHRDEELGKAVLRFDNLYSDAYKIKDHKTALAAEKERVRLLGLHKPQALDLDSEAEESGIVRLIREHLEPLGLAPADAPAEELLRLAALKIVELKSLEMLRHAPDQCEPAPREDAAPEPGEVGEGSGDLAAAADPESGAADSGDVRP